MILLALPGLLWAGGLTKHEKANRYVANQLASLISDFKHLNTKKFKESFERVMAGKDSKTDYSDAKYVYHFKQNSKNGDQLSMALGEKIAKLCYMLRKGGILIERRLVFSPIVKTREYSTPLSSQQVKEINFLIRKIKQNQIKENQQAGRAFLEKNKRKTGVTTTKSGLQFRIVTEGKGKQAKTDSIVTFEYTARLINGELFDSSAKRNRPLKIRINHIVKGLAEGLQLMKPGARSIFYLPSNLAYGNRSSSKIPGGSVLIFDVTLLKVEPGIEDTSE